MSDDRTDPHLTPVPHGARPTGLSRPAAYADAAGSGWHPSDVEEGEGFDLRRVASALFRYKWIIALAAVLGVGAAYVSWERFEPEYVAQGSLWVQADGSQGGPIVTDGIFRAQSWVDLLHSHAVLDSVVLQEKLYVQPADPAHLPLFRDFELADTFTPGKYRLRMSEDGRQLTLHRERIVVDRGAPGDSIGVELGLRWVVPAQDLVPGRDVEFSVVPPRAAASRLQGALAATLDRQGTFIRVSLRGGDPARTAATVNAVMDRHVALAADLKRGHLDEQAEILQRQLQQVQSELEQAERDLEAFRIETITLPGEEVQAVQPGLEMTRGRVFGEFFEMRIRNEHLRSDRRRIEEVLASLPDSEFPVEAVEVIPSVMSSSQLADALASLLTARSEHRRLLERYTSEHPAVREVADRIRAREADRIPSLLRQVSGQLRREEEMLSRQIDASGSDLSEIPPRAIEEARLRRQVTIAESLYRDLRGRYETASLARRSSGPDIRVLDRAGPPQSPANDQRARLAMMVFMGFLGAGLVASVLADRMDSRLRTPDEVSGAIGLTVLGAVPRIQRVNGKRGNRNRNQVYEAFRELRTNLGYAYGAAGPVVVTISSPGMEEGKTLVTTNLGVSFAGLGRRTLIVDADTRRGDLHHFLEGQRKPGLTDYLRSGASSSEVIQRTSHERLDFIGSGTQVADSPELLSSPRMGRMLAALKKGYDVILVDSPPLGAGADPLVLASLTGHLLLVVRSGSTEKEFTQAKLEPLFRLPIRLLGVVLNDYQPGRLSAHYRYYGTYLPGYEAGAEEGDDSKRKHGKAIAGAVGGK
jgi:polysaccharide biosynthesis transport protein